jgi:hypothetical protein
LAVGGLYFNAIANLATMQTKPSQTRSWSIHNPQSPREKALGNQSVASSLSQVIKVLLFHLISDVTLALLAGKYLEASTDMAAFAVPRAGL